MLAAVGNCHARLYDVMKEGTSPIRTFNGHSGNVTAVGFQKDRKWLFTGSEDGTLKIWDMRQRSGFQRSYPSKAAINTAVLHPNQGEIISGDEDGNIRVWDLTANACSYELVPDGKCAIRSITIAPDASLVMAANNRGTCFIWKLNEGNRGNVFQPLHKIEAHDTYCLKALISPDVKYLATTSADKTIKIWNISKKFELEKTLVGHQRWVWDCCFSADSQYLVSGQMWSVSLHPVLHCPSRTSRSLHLEIPPSSRSPLSSALLYYMLLDIISAFTASRIIPTILSA
eukprot:1365185-Amorphochlora_amoeboformis.AAC.1